MDATRWNPKYLEYVKATGAESPEAALARDRAAYPGASMMPFILWCRTGKAAQS